MFKLLAFMSSKNKHDQKNIQTMRHLRLPCIINNGRSVALLPFEDSFSTTEFFTKKLPMLKTPLTLFESRCAISFLSICRLKQPPCEKPPTKMSEYESSRLSIKLKICYYMTTEKKASVPLVIEISDISITSIFYL